VAGEVSRERERELERERLWEPGEVASLPRSLAPWRWMWRGDEPSSSSRKQAHGIVETTASGAVVSLSDLSMVIIKSKIWLISGLID